MGTHWWNPPGLIPVVEVVRGRDTSDETMDRAESLLRSLGKLPVRVERDVPGFVGNRLQHALWREAIALVADGVCDAGTFDLVVRNTIGLRLAAMGPLENADYVGLDLTLAIHEAVLPSLNADPGPSPLLPRAGRGRAAGRAHRCRLPFLAARARASPPRSDWPITSAGSWKSNLRKKGRAAMTSLDNPVHDLAVPAPAPNHSAGRSATRNGAWSSASCPTSGGTARRAGPTSRTLRSSGCTAWPRAGCSPRRSPR